MIIKEQSHSFKPAPEGVHNAVLVDVTPVKQVNCGKYGIKPKIRLVWELEAKMGKDDTQKEELVCRPWLTGKSYTPSLHEKAALRKDLEAWRGKKMTAEDLAGFDMEKLIGIPCQLVIQHKTAEDDVYANIVAIMKAGAVKISASGKYKRVKDREDYKPDDDKVNKELDEAAQPDAEDEVIF